MVYPKNSIPLLKVILDLWKAFDKVNNRQRGLLLNKSIIIHKLDLFY